MPILVDTNILVAANFSRDKNHVVAAQVMKDIRNEVRIVAAPTLVELFYLIADRVNYSRALQTIRATRLAFEIWPLANDDMINMEAIMERYQDAHFDYTDVAIMALSERLNITKVYTLDRRDFTIFRPKHCPHLDLLP
ncbi:MAG: PIN domain-containing protein [Chloroflexota bacterium]